MFSMIISTLKLQKDKITFKFQTKKKKLSTKHTEKKPNQTKQNANTNNTVLFIEHCAFLYCPLFLMQTNINTKKFLHYSLLPPQLTSRCIITIIPIRCTSTTIICSRLCTFTIPPFLFIIIHSTH